MANDTSASGYREEPVGVQPRRHGRPSSWTLLTVDIIALFVGGLAVIGHWWVVFWVCAGVVVLSVPARPRHRTRTGRPPRGQRPGRPGPGAPA